jgi:hypothetical protein
MREKWREHFKCRGESHDELYDDAGIVLTTFTYLFEFLW